MPQVRFGPTALRDMERLRDFLRPKNPAAAKRAAASMVKSVQVLGCQPQIGRLVEGMPEVFREWLIEFGDSVYIARYYYDGGEFVTVLAIRHQKEMGFT
ncbi:plasmid stabilization protein [Acidithiobacillus marinus]|uniref:Plasmid stabilization protein n=1 Tax=Acidithiobacillus marinus TaxID=187490 RepID=A0A2I1DPA0_9PROT|nr:type II toxin-antitoxin system RelE/ParE family toxin [Acidithiobacillus marinus]PKY11693.1 plasmid stabilization protein [Acidithiobacillus marinus]